MAVNHTCASIDDVIALLKHDSTHGPLSRIMTGRLSVCALPNGSLSVNEQEIRLISERDATKISWAALGVEYVAECTGKLRSTALASAHVSHGRAKKVLISAPCSDSPTFVYQVNTSEYIDYAVSTSVFSCASCTTNCLAPILKVLNENFGVDQALMTTVHASTQSQHVLDGYSQKDRRAGRSIMGNIIPTSTGAAAAISAVLPELKGRVNGISVRVPTTNVSMVDLTVATAKKTSLTNILAAFRGAAEQELAGVLAVEDEELVSCDFLGHSSSAIVDAKASKSLNECFFKIIAWYDNEWAYSCRLLDMLAFMARIDLQLM
jgi:glyceraldehyde 3-phosphate dehydrogenase